jgi:hypothetical protein
MLNQVSAIASYIPLIVFIQAWIEHSEQCVGLMGYGLMPNKPLLNLKGINILFSIC